MCGKIKSTEDLAVLAKQSFLLLHFTAIKAPLQSAAGI